MATGVSATSTASPGGMTRAGIAKMILAYVQADPDDDNIAIANNSINMAIDVLNEHQWRKLVDRNDVTLVADQAEYDVPATFKDPRFIELLDSGSNVVRRLPYLDLTSGFEVTDDNKQTTFYTVDYYRRKITLLPAPNSSFVTAYPTARVRFYRRFQHLTADGDTLGVVGSGFTTFLILYGRAEMASIRAPDKAPLAYRLAFDHLKTLKRRDNEVLEDFTGGITYR